MMTDVLKEAKEKLAPDRRTAVFDVQGELRGDAVVLTGEIHSADMKRALVAIFKEHGVKALADSLTALPQPSLGEKTRGVISVSVANIRTKPDHPAEMATQVLLGTPVRILKKEHGWLYIQTPDDYLGWTDDDIQVMTSAEYEAWVARPKIIVTAEVSSVRASKESGSQQIGDIVAGCILALKKDARTHYEVEYPDTRTGFVRKRCCTSWCVSCQGEGDTEIHRGHGKGVSLASRISGAGLRQKRWIVPDSPRRCTI